MSRATITGFDVDRLRAVVDLANDSSDRSPLDVTFAVLDRVREVIGADESTFLHMEGGAQHVRLLQWTDGVECFTEVNDEADGEEHMMFWKYYASGSCSWPDRAKDPMVIANKDVYSQREWAEDPMHLEFLPDVYDEILAATPLRPGVNLRLLLRRSGRPAFSDLDCFLVQLLQPHLQPLFRRTLLSVFPPTEPQLTDRQHQILGLVRQGMTNGQVARQLDISPGTVRKHLENSFDRLHVQSRVAAVAAAFPNVDEDLVRS